MGKSTLMKRNMTRVALVLSLCVSLILPLLGGVAEAATTIPATQGSNDTLKISPLETELTVNPGSSTIVKTYVTNVTNSTMDLQVIENDFIAGNGENGTPYIILGANSYAPTHSLKRFMLPLSNISIPAGERKEVDVTIQVPKTAQAGGYYGAIRFAPASSNADTSVNLNASAASLILLTVSGDLVQKLALSNFNVEQNGVAGGSFRNSKNLSLSFTFQNEGNVHDSPFGQIYVKKGNKIVYTYNFNQSQPQQTILPDSSRKWDIPLKGIGSFGKYLVGATYTYGTSGTSIQITKTIWVIPLAYIIGGIIAVIAVIVLIAFIWVFLKSYKRRILRKSRRRY